MLQPLVQCNHVPVLKSTELTSGDEPGHITSLESAIDVDDRHSGRATTHHTQQRRDALEIGTIPDAGGYRHNRAGD